MQRIRFYEWVLLGLGTAVCCGCGGGETGPPTVSVTGTVTRKGAPLEGVTVSFVPDGSGQSAVGVTDASGKYKLTTRVKDDGAVAGQYKVTLEKYEGEKPAVTEPTKVHADYDISNEYPEGYKEDAPEKEPSKNLLPTQYSDPSTSGFTAEVRESNSANNFDFDLKS